jgi:hypothetical protein
MNDAIAIRNLVVRNRKVCRSKFTSFYLLLFASSCLCSTEAWADTQRASRLATGVLVPPATAWSHYGTGTQRTNTIPSTWRNSDEIIALARGFGSDEPSISADEYAQRVLRSLKSNIETEFRFELGKGGRMAWIDQSGTALDQAELMDALLEKKGISSEVVVGTITLSADQFGRWSGLVNSVNAANQSFQVEARAACEFLAAGGVPATVNGSTSCASLTGALTTVTMAHAWVQAGGKSYDPAFKARKLFQGTDIATAAGCGTETVSTCGSQVTTAAMTGATQGTLGGSPTIRYVNETALGSTMTALATNVENTIRSTAPEATLLEFVGGSETSSEQDTSVATTLPFGALVQRTFGGEIPDQYRVRLRFRYQTIDVNFFVDELDVSGLAWQGPGASLLISGTVIASAPTCGGNQPPAACNQYGSDWLLDVNHQYANTALADEFIRQRVNPLGGFTVQVSPGEVSQARSFYAEQFAKQINKKSTVPLFYLNGISVGKITANATAISDILARQSLASNSLKNGLDFGLTRHHRVISIEAAYSGPSAISSTGTASITPYQFSDARRGASFHTLNAIDAIAESDLSNFMLRYSVPSLSKWSDQSGIRFVSVAPAGVSTLIGQLTDYQAANVAGLQWAASNGFTSILPIDGEPPCKTSLTFNGQTTTGCPKAKDAPSFIFGSVASAHLLGGQYKGTDYFDSPEPSNEEEDFSLTQAKYLDVDSGLGTFVLRPSADIATGQGNFPARLSMGRSYDSSTRQYETNRQYFLFGADYRMSKYYNAPGANYAINVPQIGGGWSHNFQNIVYIDTDHHLSFGQTSALHASAFLTSILVLRDQFTTGNFQNNLSSIFVMDWLEEQIFQNAVVVELQEGGGEKFLQLPSGQYAGSPYASSKLTVSGSYVGPRPLTTFNFDRGQFGYVGLNVTYERGSGERLVFSESDTYWHGTNAFLTSWTSPSGLRANFNWSDQPEEAVPGNVSEKGEPGRLVSVSNSLGRSLSFSSTQITPTAPYPSPNDAVDQRWLLNSVTDESGRSVSYTRANCASAPQTSLVTAPFSFLCGRLDVTLPDQTLLRYSYEPGPDSPDHDPLQYAPTALRRLYTGRDLQNPFQTLRFDELYRIRETEDGTGVKTKILPGAVGGERFKIGVSIDGLGNRGVAYYDENNRLIERSDPLGRTSRKHYSEGGLLLREITPEGLAAEYTYDVRGNRLSSCQIAKGRIDWTSLTNKDAAQCNPGQGDLIERTFYVGGPSLQPAQCANMLTCNRPAYMIDPRGFRSDYTWSSVHGGILSEKSGLDASGACALAGGICPEKTYQYTAFTGTDGATFYLPTSVIEKIDATRSMTTSFEYDPTKKFVLKGKVENDGTQQLRTCYSYDSVGRLLSETNPLGTGATCP